MPTKTPTITPTELFGSSDVVDSSSDKAALVVVVLKRLVLLGKSDLVETVIVEDDFGDVVETTTVGDACGDDVNVLLVRLYKKEIHHNCFPRSFSYWIVGRTRTTHFKPSHNGPFHLQQQRGLK